MVTVITMPKTGISVETCVLTRWVKHVGDQVQKGDPLFEYETDKSCFEEKSTEEGTLLQTFFEEGDDVPVLAPVCQVGGLGEDVPQKAGVSPRAKMMAQKLCVSWEHIQGSGPNGRVVERDIREARQSGATVEAVPIPQEEPQKQAAYGEYDEVAFSGIRRSIAQNMTQSLALAAQLTHMAAFDATVLLGLRDQIRSSGLGEKTGKITINDLILFAVSRTLPSFPEMNSHCLGDKLHMFHDVHLGIATDTPRGLMVPTLREANRLTLTEISRQSKELIDRCRSGNVDPALLQGGTFTVTNLGSLGIEQFTPILNPPQVGILGVGALVNRVREEDGILKLYPTIGLSLTYDHRGVDGAPASRFLQALKNNLEHIDLLWI